MSGPIYTRTGDGGDTSLGDGTRVPKSSLRVAAYGVLDEANSCVGLARAALDPAVEGGARLDETLAFVQHRLMNCAGLLASPPHVPSAVPPIVEDDVTRLELAIDEMTAATGDMAGFVLPSGCEAACRLHVARTVVRGAERAIMALAGSEHVDAHVRAFVNRTGDLLFAAARYANALAGEGDTPWDPTL